jgi:hypothetical protein
MSSTEYRTQQSKAFDGLDQGFVSWLFGYDNDHWFPAILRFALLLTIVGIGLYMLWSVGYPDPREVGFGRR